MSKKYEQWKREISCALLDVNERPIGFFEVPEEVLAEMFVDELDHLDAAQIILDEEWGDQAPDIGEFYESGKRSQVN